MPFFRGPSSMSSIHVSRKQDMRLHGYDVPSSRVECSSSMPIVLVIKATHMYHIEVPLKPTNRNAHIHESGVIPMASSCSVLQYGMCVTNGGCP
jgi:hypothetical protein